MKKRQKVVETFQKLIFGTGRANNTVQCRYHLDLINAAAEWGSSKDYHKEKNNVTMPAARKTVLEGFLFGSLAHIILNASQQKKILSAVFFSSTELEFLSPV